MLKVSFVMILKLELQCKMAWSGKIVWVTGSLVVVNIAVARWHDLERFSELLDV